MFFSAGALLGVVTGIVGIILGMMAKKEDPSGMAQAGFIMSIIAVAACAFSFLACVACVGALVTFY